MRKFLSSLQNRMLILISSIIINFALVVLLIIFNMFYYYFAFSFLLTVTFLIFAYENLSSPNYKFIFSLIIFIAPIFGFVLHSLTNARKSTKNVRMKWRKINYENAGKLQSNAKIFEELQTVNPNASKVANQINATTNMPIYDKTSVAYLESGMVYRNELIKELKSAKKFILIEVSKIIDGEFWKEIFAVLKRKAIEGLDIKMLYDEKQCLTALKEKRAFEKFINHGIKVLPFNKIRLFSTSFRFSRDKRNLFIIDGVISISGGVEICDEYIKEEHLHFKSSDGIKVTGDAVWSQTILFFSNWRLFSKKTIDVNEYNTTIPAKAKSKHFTQIYGRVPFYKENINKNILISLLSLARKSVLIIQPYFIIDNEIKNTLKIVLRSGVDVKMLISGKTEGAWKKSLTLSNFEELIKERIKIYQYDESYMANSFILIDDEILLYGGGLNDIRNMSYSFELATLLIGHTDLNTKIIAETEKKIINSHLITLRDLQNLSILEKVSFD